MGRAHSSNPSLFILLQTPTFFINYSLYHFSSFYQHLLFLIFPLFHYPMHLSSHLSTIPSLHSSISPLLHSSPFPAVRDEQCNSGWGGDLRNEVPGELCSHHLRHDKWGWRGELWGERKGEEVRRDGKTREYDVGRKDGPKVGQEVRWDGKTICGDNIGMRGWGGSVDKEWSRLMPPFHHLLPTPLHSQPHSHPCQPAPKTKTTREQEEIKVRVEIACFNRQVKVALISLHCPLSMLAEPRIIPLCGQWIFVLSYREENKAWLKIIMDFNGWCFHIFIKRWQG